VLGCSQTRWLTSDAVAVAAVCIAASYVALDALEWVQSISRPDDAKGTLTWGLVSLGLV